MKSAFGIKLEHGTDPRYLTGSSRNGSVCFSKTEKGWIGSLRVGDIVIPENTGSASVDACYRSLRGCAGNAMRALVALGVKP